MPLISIVRFTGMVDIGISAYTPVILIVTTSSLAVRTLSSHIMADTAGIETVDAAGTTDALGMALTTTDRIQECVLVSMTDTTVADSAMSLDAAHGLADNLGTETCSL